MLKILCSDKDDWKIKCAQQPYNKQLYALKYINFDAFSKIKRYDLVLPLYEKDIFILNDSYKTQSEKFLIPSNETVHFCCDKYRFNIDLIENGFEEYIPKLLLFGTKSFPYILKKSIDEWGLNSHIVDSEEKEKHLSELLNISDYFKQEYIIDENEYTTHFIFDKHKIVYDFTLHFKFPHNIFIKGSQSPSFKIAEINTVDTLFCDVFEKILTHINYKGVGCFNYKIVDGLPQIFELNPRPGGSLPLDLENFLHAYMEVCGVKSKNSSWIEKLKMLF